MTGPLLLGWKYLAHHRLKAAILVAAVTLMIFLPAATRLLVSDSAQALTARADQTPLLLGAAGSPLELVLNALYFHPQQPPPLTHADFTALRDAGLARAIPLYTRFQSRGDPIVGTTLEYFDFRDLALANGRWMGILGECVIGARIAAERGLDVGDSLLSSPETVFDIAGVYPLKLGVTGVLQPTGSVDDDAIFVDYRTAWVIEGLGHGHQDLQEAGTAAGVLNRTDKLVTANASVVQYAEINRDNVDEFHFHGDLDGLPLSSVIALPGDEKSGALLRGRYQDNDRGLQLALPSAVLDDLLGTVFTVQNYVIFGLALLAVSTVAVIMLVFLLSHQLRRGEFRTLRRIGASRNYVAALVLSEIGFVILTSALLAAVMLLLVRAYAAVIMARFLGF
jgi:putative ABC transport system permease protein